MHHSTPPHTQAWPSKDCAMGMAVTTKLTTRSRKKKPPLFFLKNHPVSLPPTPPSFRFACVLVPNQDWSLQLLGIFFALPFCLVPPPSHCRFAPGPFLLCLFNKILFGITFLHLKNAGISRARRNSPPPSVCLALPSLAQEKKGMRQRGLKKPFVVRLRWLTAFDGSLPGGVCSAFQVTS